MVDLDLAAQLDSLAEAIARMRPLSSRNPHAFHEDRSELAGRARALARRARSSEPTAAAEVLAPVGRQATSRHQVLDLDGRSVLVLKRRQAQTIPRLDRAIAHTQFLLDELAPDNGP